MTISVQCVVDMSRERRSRPPHANYMRPSASIKSRVWTLCTIHPKPNPGCKSPSSAQLQVPEPRVPTSDMIIRLGRLTPGYFRLLQRQVAGEIQTQPQDRAVNQIAMMLAIMGLSLSYYSAKQMTEKVHSQQSP
uniref:Uncharacterized protein n=1 Tax=Knipowitschia caucasica TaxID=637954 RepID=A0AAV2MAE8_KNICA